MGTNQFPANSHHQPFPLLALPNELINNIVDEAIRQDMENQRHFFGNKYRRNRPRFDTLMLAQANKFLHETIKPAFYSKVAIVLAPIQSNDRPVNWLRTDWRSVGSATRYRPPHALVQHLAIEAATTHEIRHACSGIRASIPGYSASRRFVADFPNLHSVTFTHELKEWGPSHLIFGALEDTLPPHPNEGHIRAVVQGWVDFLHELVVAAPNLAVVRVQRNLLAGSTILISCNSIAYFVTVMNKLVHLDGLVECLAADLISNRHRLPIRGGARRGAIVDKMVASLQQA